MKTDPECILCYERAAFFLTRRFALSEDRADALCHAALRTIADSDFQDAPPVNARKVYEIIREYTGEADPFRQEKDRSTACAKELLPTLAAELKKFSDPLEAGVRLAIAGNIIDYGVNTAFDLNTARERIAEILNGEINRNELEIFRRALDKAQRILYITDNCGEAVFDSQLIRFFGNRTTVAVRGKPVLNDVTRREATESGLTQASARLIDTGDDTPGIDLRRTSPEFTEAFHSADLIISKGQGNYETLCGTDRPIVWLLRAKCPVIIRKLGNVKPGSAQILHANFNV